MIDADAHTVQDRMEQLSHALEDGQVQPISNGERIAVLVPKRNVESWILCLNAQVVNEATDYKGTRHDWKQLIPQAAETLFEWTRPNAVRSEHCIDSLSIGLSELSRLEF